MERRTSELLTLMAATLLLGACGSGPAARVETGMEGAEVIDSSMPSDSSGSASTFGVSEDAAFEGHPLDDPDSPLSDRTVYFAFDSSRIEGENRAVVEAHALWLAQHPGASVTLEGHADERGTREYNVALGERRANSVRRLMALSGASGGQIRAISYGEERPVMEGHDESAWRLNRRVEIIYRSRE